MVFGHISGAPSGMPALFSYQRLVNPFDEQVDAVPAWDNFGPELAAAAVFGGKSSRYLFVDGDIVEVLDAEIIPEDPRAVLTSSQKLLVGSNSLLHFSTIRDAMDFGGTGSGFIDMAFEIGTDATVTAIGRYESNVAVFFYSDIMILFIDADPDETLPVQRLGNIGTFSARAVVPYNDSDLIFYDQTGIRSLRARDSSKSAMTVDIGSAIDTLTQAEYLVAKAEFSEGINLRLEQACGVVDPRTGRLWMAINDVIFVLSNYPATKVTAWSIYRPGFRVDAMVVFDGHIYLRSGDDFYVYGGPGEPVYSADVQAEVWLPYLDADAPATPKMLMGVDAACRGSWEVRVGFDPTNLDASDLLARITETTFGIPPVGGMGEATHISLRFKATAPISTSAPAVLSSAMIHHSLDDQVDG